MDSRIDNQESDIQDLHQTRGGFCKTVCGQRRQGVSVPVLLDEGPRLHRCLPRIGCPDDIRGQRHGGDGHRHGEDRIGDTRGRAAYEKNVGGVRKNRGGRGGRDRRRPDHRKNRYATVRRIRNGPAEAVRTRIKDNREDPTDRSVGSDYSFYGLRRIPSRKVRALSRSSWRKRSSSWKTRPSLRTSCWRIPSSISKPCRSSWMRRRASASDS